MTPLEYETLAQLAARFEIGSVVIAGTFDGQDVMAVRRQCGEDKRIIVIDSFEGLAEPTELDKTGKEIALKGECNVGGIRAYKKRFKDAGVIPPDKIYKMWISEKTLQTVYEERISLLFLDLDHYQPTHDCLKKFLPWMIPNNKSIILVHDYDFHKCPGVKVACHEITGQWVKIPKTGFGYLVLL